MSGIKDDLDKLSGSELQESQSGGDGGLFGSNRSQPQSAQGAIGGRQAGGAAEGPDFRQDGGSSGVKVSCSQRSISTANRYSTISFFLT